MCLYVHSLLAGFPFFGVEGGDGRGKALAPVLLPLASTEQNGEPSNRLSDIGIEMTVETGKINGAQFLKIHVNCTR